MSCDGFFDQFFQTAYGFFCGDHSEEIELLVLDFIFEKYLIEALS
jgi:hypothetical protein